MDFWFYVFAFGLTAAIAGVWCIAKALFERWLNNDWCRHEWDMWSGVARKPKVNTASAVSATKAKGGWRDGVDGL